MLLDALWPLWKKVLENNGARDDTGQWDPDCLRHPDLLQLHAEPRLWMSFLLLKSSDNHEWVSSSWRQSVIGLHEDCWKNQCTGSPKVVRSINYIVKCSREQHTPTSRICSSVQCVGSESQRHEGKTALRRRRAYLLWRNDWGETLVIIYQVLKIEEFDEIGQSCSHWWSSESSPDPIATDGWHSSHNQEIGKWKGN